MIESSEPRYHYERRNRKEKEEGKLPQCLCKWEKAGTLLEAIATWPFTAAVANNRQRTPVVEVIEKQEGFKPLLVPTRNERKWEKRIKGK